MANIDLRHGLNADEVVACDSCDWIGAVSSTSEIVDAQERLNPGAKVPVGDCPKCRCLCYLIRSKRYADVAWRLDDVQMLMPSWSDDKAAKWLSSNENHMQDAMVSGGWEAMQNLLEYDGVTVEKPFGG